MLTATRWWPASCCQAVTSLSVTASSDRHVQKRMIHLTAWVASLMKGGWQRINLIFFFKLTIKEMLETANCPSVPHPLCHKSRLHCCAMTAKQQCHSRNLPGPALPIVPGCVPTKLCQTEDSVICTGVWYLSSVHACFVNCRNFYK